MLATYGTISSHFNDLESGRWLLMASMLASCAIQPIVSSLVSYQLHKLMIPPKYGKLSNIYGRKPVLLLNYVLFGLGSAISYVSHNSFALHRTDLILGDLASL